MTSSTQNWNRTTGRDHCKDRERRKGGEPGVPERGGFLDGEMKKGTLAGQN